MTAAYWVMSIGSSAAQPARPVTANAATKVAARNLKTLVNLDVPFVYPLGYTKIHQVSTNFKDNSHAD
jgi:hypothetical protein